MHEMTCPDRTQFGAFVSGLLSPEETATLQRHIDQCPTCTSEISSMGSVVQALHDTDLSPVDREPEWSFVPKVRGLDAIFAQITVERRKARNRRIVVGIAACLVLLVGSVGAVSLATRRKATGINVALAYPIRGRADVKLTWHTWGTEIEIHAKDIPPGVTYGVWLERRDGSRVPAGSFTTVSTPTFLLRMTSALPSEETQAIGMTDFATRNEVRVLLPVAKAK